MCYKRFSSTQLLGRIGFLTYVILFERRLRRVFKQLNASIIASPSVASTSLPSEDEK